MKDENKRERLILCTSFALIIVMGVASKLIKVPMKMDNVTIDRVPAKIDYIKESERDRYVVTIPSGYDLRMDENGEFYGQKETTREETVEVTLSDYIEYQLRGIKKK